MRESSFAVVAIACAGLLTTGCATQPDEPQAEPRLSGRVIDATGSPLADVPVRIYGGLATRWQTGATVTDRDGHFAFAEVSGAKIRPDDGAPWADYVGVCAGALVDGCNPAAYLPWVDVTIPPGETATIDLVLDAAEVERRLATLR